MIEDVKKEIYTQFGPEWKSEMMQMRKEDLVAMLRGELKVKTVSTLHDAGNFVNGCVNDFEAGLSTKEETVDALAKFTGRLMDIFWETAVKKIKADPNLLNSPKL